MRIFLPCPAETRGVISPVSASLNSVIKRAGKQKFDEFAAVNVVADFKDCVIALPFDNGTGKKPIAQGARVFVVLGYVGQRPVMKAEAVTAVLQRV